MNLFLREEMRKCHVALSAISSQKASARNQSPAMKKGNRHQFLNPRNWCLSPLFPFYLLNEYVRPSRMIRGPNTPVAESQLGIVTIG
jgi:hypothetical protein